MAAPLSLDAAHTRGVDVDTFDLHLRFPPGAFDESSRLVVTSVMRLVPDPITAHLVERVGSRTVIAPIEGLATLTDGEWIVLGVRCEFRARHANDGPASAYVVCADGTTLDVEVRPATTTWTPEPIADPAASSRPYSSTASFAAPVAMRIVHLDVARRWYEPEVVLRLIDVAASQGFSHVHLHLTDDEAWRLPVAGIPRLGDRGGARGHGLAIGALCGSGSQRYGRCYTADEIGEWVRRADSLGVTLVPEVDVPGHCHGALAALPELRDPDDRSGAASIQGFVDNSLVPGHDRNPWFLDAVFSALADLFPTSPHLHVGGDEVPDGAWSGSPIAKRFAADHDVSTNELYRPFMRSIIDRARAVTGRSIGAWEEAATSGAMRPDDGYVVAWTSPDVAGRLAAAGFDVVVSPGQAYYLDMAQSTNWDAPGASWAGHVTVERTAAFDPTGGWGPEQLEHLAGLQACIWSEHVASVDILDALVFPRLDVIAERALTGSVDPAATARRPSGPTFASR